MILLTVALYDIVAVIVTLSALVSARLNWMPGLLICGIVSGIALTALGLVLATHD